MSKNADKSLVHLDGSPAQLDQPFVKVTFQHGDPEIIGINGCRIEDVLDILTEKLLNFQGRDLSCKENAEALLQLDKARESLILRRRRREQQKVIGKRKKHESKS